MAVTSADVARRAGVSRTAVSLVLNGRAEGSISAENQGRILAAAEELGYQPNSAAVSLRRRTTATVGLITDEITQTPFAGRLLQGASDVAYEHGHLVFVVDTGLDLEREADAVRVLRGRQVDAFMFAAMSHRPVDVAPEMRRLPLVLANCYATTRDVACTVPDEFGGAYAATVALLELGHRDIVVFSGLQFTPGRPPVPAVHLRIEGFRAAMREIGLLADRVVPTGWDIDDGALRAREVLSGERPPTAIMCHNDRAAVGVALTAARLGLDVPGDLSIVGYDDEERIAGRMEPRLATVALPHRDMGSIAMEMLMSALAEGRDVGTEQVLVPCPFIPRASAGPVPTR